MATQPDTYEMSPRQREEAEARKLMDAGLYLASVLKRCRVTLPDEVRNALVRFVEREAIYDAALDAWIDQEAEREHEKRAPSVNASADDLRRMEF